MRIEDETGMCGNRFDELIGMFRSKQGATDVYSRVK